MRKTFRINNPPVRAEGENMGTTYTLFTEIKVDNRWICINGEVRRMQPIEHPVMVPTLRTDAKLSFAKAYRELQEDGYAITVDELSDNLRAGVTNWLNPENSIEFAVDYDKIRQMRVRSGKEHCAFALRSEIANYENGESDDIWDFVSVAEYKRMDDELKKAYQYYEWNDLSGVYRYYEEIGVAVDMQLAGWYAVNCGSTIEDIRIIVFTS